MTDEETIDERNDMREFLHYSVQPSPVSLGEILYWKLKQQALQDRHKSSVDVDIWRGVLPVGVGG